MLGLAILFAALGLGFAIGYGTRGIITQKRRAEYLTYAPYLEPVDGSPDANRRGRPVTTASRAFLIVADHLGFALALDFTLALLVILLLPRWS